MVKVINDQYLLSFWLLLISNWEDSFNSNSNIKKKTEEAEKHGYINSLYIINFGHLEIKRSQHNYLFASRLNPWASSTACVVPLPAKQFHQVCSLQLLWKFSVTHYWPGDFCRNCLWLAICYVSEYWNISGQWCSGNKRCINMSLVNKLVWRVENLRNNK